MEKKPLIKIASIWQNQDKKGNTYFTGTLGSARIVILKNNYKKESKHPDFNIFVQEPEKKEYAQSGGGIASPADDLEEIPF